MAEKVKEAWVRMEPVAEAQRCQDVSADKVRDMEALEQYGNCSLWFCYCVSLEGKHNNIIL